MRKWLSATARLGFVNYNFCINTVNALQESGCSVVSTRKPKASSRAQPTSTTQMRFYQFSLHTPAGHCEASLDKMVLFPPLPLVPSPRRRGLGRGFLAFESSTTHKGIFYLDKGERYKIIGAIFPSPK